MKNDSAIRGMIRHRAKKFMLEGKSDMVQFYYDGNKLFATYDHEGQKETYEVQVELKLVNNVLQVAE